MWSVNFFKQSKLSHWGKAFPKLIWTLIGTLLPVMGGAILLKLFSQWQGFNVFFKHGEFAIYSAAILTGSFFIFINNFRENSFLVIVNFLLLLSAVLFYAGVQSKEILTINIPFDTVFLRNGTFWIFIIAVILSYLGNLFENVKWYINIQKIRADEIGQLRNEFNQLGGN